MSNNKLDILLQLGETERSGQWPDYLEHGFTCDDAVDLLAIVTDETLNQADQDSNEVWAPLHAWRALGQLGCPECAEPLIKQFGHFYRDDWAQSELPKVVAMMGERAIEPLTTYLNQPGPDAFARAMASEGLKEIALHTPKLRETIVTTLTDYLKMPDPEERILNACVVSDLIDLSATESIDTIRDLYSKGLAELIHCGDIEEVEMALGLRSKRSTPKPDYFKDSPLRQLIPFPPSEEDEDEQHTQIDVYLSKYGTDDSILDASELDGFITAVTCSPSLIKPSAWFPAIWGGEDHMPEWADDNELESFSTAVITHYNTVLESLRKSWLLNCTQN